MIDDRRATGTIQQLIAEPALAIEHHPVRGGRAPAGSGTDDSAETTRHLTDDRDPIAQALNDVVVRRLFAAGLDLEAVAGLIGDHRASARICHAIDEMDGMIRDIREAVFSSRPR
jgi:signal transduction histidine kinase